MEKFLAVNGTRRSPHPPEWVSNERKSFRGGGGAAAKAVSYHSRSSAESQIFDAACLAARNPQFIFFSVSRLSPSHSLINPSPHSVTELTQFSYLNL